ncbi:serine/threonine protein kinase [Venturia nashicola]|uniref:Serine/threonine protein kinase n=1 Tax=Venturia nashicola TaxID=86259 RepID=A0A4Z1NZ85_9PEZI|nr:serine/threonine protein kinase [Venturia nashicola]
MLRHTTPKANAVPGQYIFERLLSSNTAGIPMTAGMLLRKSIGCLASAVVYLHESSIRHKYLKPSNILLYPDGLRLTDFGTATDFGDFSHSATEGVDRGTPKYFSPETAAYEQCGRASDIFSLGPDKDRSFQANLASTREWLKNAHFNVPDNFLLDEIRSRLNLNPDHRPNIGHIQSHLKAIECIAPTPWDSYFYLNCCRFDSGFRTDCLPNHAEVAFVLTSENTSCPGTQTCTFEPRSECCDFIEYMHVISDQIPPDQPGVAKVCDPFKFSQKYQIISSSNQLGILVVLKRDRTEAQYNRAKLRSMCLYKTVDPENSLGPSSWAHRTTEEVEASDVAYEHVEVEHRIDRARKAIKRLSSTQQTAVHRYLNSINESNRKWTLIELKVRDDSASHARLQGLSKGKCIEVTVRRIGPSSELGLTTNKPFSRMKLAL